MNRIAPQAAPHRCSTCHYWPALGSFVFEDRPLGKCQNPKSPTRGETMQRVEGGECKAFKRRTEP